MKTLLLYLIDRLGLYFLFNRFTKNTGTIFMLHDVQADHNNNGKVTTKHLYQYFEYLKKHNYRVVSLSDFVNAIRNHEETYKTIVFTVDDGYRNFYLNAYQAFYDYGYPASVFLVGDFIEKKAALWWDRLEYTIKHATCKNIDLNFMNRGVIQINDSTQRAAITFDITEYLKKIDNSARLQLLEHLIDKLKVNIDSLPAKSFEPMSWDEINEMSENGIDFYPHTKSHPILSRVETEQLKNEIRAPKSLIERRLNKPANIFCYPNGQADDFNEKTISELKAADYIAAVTTLDGFDNTKLNPDIYRLKRFGLPAEEIVFKQYACGLENFKRRLLINSE